MLKGQDLFLESNFTSATVFLAYLAVLLMLFFIFRHYKKIADLKSAPAKLILLALALFYFGIFIFINPGFVGYDDVFMMDVVRGGIAMGWQSLTYSFVIAVGQMLFADLGFSVFLSIWAFLYICTLSLGYIDRASISAKKKLLFSVILFLLALHPLNQGLIFYHCRDTVFSLFLIYLGFQIIEKHEWTIWKLVGFAGLLVLLGDLRQEAKIYLFIFPGIFYFCKKWKTRELTVYLGSAVGFGLVYYGLLASFFNVSAYTYDYQATAYVLPLSEIFHQKDTEVPEIHRKNIDAVLNIEKLKTHYNPIDIDPFHNGAYNYQTTPEQWDAFQKSAFSLIWDNWGIYLKSRVHLFKSMINIGQENMILSDDLRVNSQKEFAGLLQRLNFSDDSHKLSKFFTEYRDFLIGLHNNFNFWIYWFSSLLFPLIFLLGCIFSFRWLPDIAGFALVIAARVPILFLLAPASYTKYIYSVFLFFTFGLIIYLTSYFEKYKSKAIV